MIIIRKFPMYTYGKIGPLYTMRTAPNALQRLRGAAARRRGVILRPGGRASRPHVEAVDLSGRTPRGGQGLLFGVLAASRAVPGSRGEGECEAAHDQPRRTTR